jgi:hypothetical protein
MNSLEVKKYLKNKHLNEDSLIVNYDFIDFSGNFIKNEIFKNNIQFSGDGTNNYLNGLYNPGFFNKISSNIISGSGKFDSDNFLRTSRPIIPKEFTCIIKYQNILNYSNNKDGIGEILFEIKNFYNNSSGSYFFAGLNDIRKIFSDFSGSSAVSIGLDNKLAQNNILAINYADNNFNLYHIDLFNQKITENNFKINDENFNSENKIFIFGGTDNPNYTGFFGYINNVLLFNESLAKNDIYNISFLLEKTGEFLEESFITLTGLYQESGYVNPTGILDIGIIDYQIVQENVNIKNINSNINTHINLYSGIMGQVTGEKIEYKYVQNVEKIITGQKIINQYDNFSINLYSGQTGAIQNIFKSNNSLLFDNHFERFSL